MGNAKCRFSGGEVHNLHLAWDLPWTGEGAKRQGGGGAGGGGCTGGAACSNPQAGLLGLPPGPRLCPPALGLGFRAPKP